MLDALQHYWVWTLGILLWGIFKGFPWKSGPETVPTPEEAASRQANIDSVNASYAERTAREQRERDWLAANPPPPGYPWVSDRS